MLTCSGLKDVFFDIWKIMLIHFLADKIETTLICLCTNEARICICPSDSRLFVQRHFKLFYSLKFYYFV